MRSRRQAGKVALLALGAAAILGGATGCGSTVDARPVAADRLGEPGARWATIPAGERLTIVRLCRPAAAVAAGRADASVAASYLSDRYRAVAAVPDDVLGRALGRWFAPGAGHAAQPLREGCATVADRLAHLARYVHAPHASFAAPASNADGPLAVTLTGPAVRLRARMTPASARLTINHAADRAPTTTTWTVTRRGGAATIALRDVPAGTSYLRVDATTRTGHWRRLVVLHRRAAGAVVRFPPIVLRGTGPQRIATVDVPGAAVATVRSAGGPLALSTPRALLLSVGGSTRAPVAVAAGRYADVTASAAGAWTVTITPAP